MTVEQIYMRQEIRQMLNEAGINKNTLKDLVKEVLNEEMEKAIHQAVNESNIDSTFNKLLKERTDGIIRDEIRTQIRDRISGIFNRMIITVDVTDRNGSSCITK